MENNDCSTVQVEIKATQLDIFQDLLGLMKNFADDERIPAEVRRELANSLIILQKRGLHNEES